MNHSSLITQSLIPESFAALNRWHATLIQGFKDSRIQGFDDE